MRHCEKCGGTLFDADECVVCTLYDVRARLAAAEERARKAADERTAQIVAWLRMHAKETAEIEADHFRDAAPCDLYECSLTDAADAIERGDYHS